MLPSQGNQIVMHNPKISRLLIIGLMILFITSILLASGCSPKEKGPFNYADGVYEGASDLYD